MNAANAADSLKFDLLLRDGKVLFLRQNGIAREYSITAASANPNGDSELEIRDSLRAPDFLEIMRRLALPFVRKF